MIIRDTLRKILAKYYNMGIMKKFIVMILPIIFTIIMSSVITNAVI